MLNGNQVAMHLSWFVGWDGTAEQDQWITRGWSRWARSSHQIRCPIYQLSHIQEPYVTRLHQQLKL